MTSRNLPFVLLLLTALLSGCFSDVLSSSHATRAEAVDTIGRGWIPAVLPMSAIDIRESHNLDTNVGHGSFSFGSADLQSFKAALTPIPPGHSAKSRSRKDLEASGFVFYSYEDFDIAVNWSEHKGQFWLGPAQ
jgi:hypothetical protein